MVQIGLMQQELFRVWLDDWSAWQIHVRTVTTGNISDMIYEML